MILQLDFTLLNLRTPASPPTASNAGVWEFATEANSRMSEDVSVCQGYLPRSSTSSKICKNYIAIAAYLDFAARWLQRLVSTRKEEAAGYSIIMIDK